MMKKLRLILGDQLNSQHGWFKKVDMNCTYVMMEVKTETNYTKHHYQKIAAFFLSMRQFADELKKKGHQVTYIKLENKKNKQNFSQNLKELIHAKKIEKFEYQLPDEYRLDEGIKKFVKSLKIESQHYDTEHFITSRDSFNTYFKGKKSFLMENFYRKLRMENNILMDGEKPIGGAWNFDKENRKPPKKGTKWPKDKSFKHEAKHIYASLDKLKIKAFGKKAPVHYPISRKESLQVLNHFIKNLLVHFGDYQDAMVTSQNYLYHSKLSFALNVKMLSPLEVIKKVEEVYLKNKKNIKISQVEGFIRQILGWREYVRGLYWNQMPDYKQLNYLGHKNKLPDYFWTGETKMNCLSDALRNSLDNSYAHHIQRLMVISNFALLAGIEPAQVNEWYLGVYADAIEWVQLPNTHGMGQYADGGIMATKPYVSSANYINKMSDHCKSCVYNLKNRIEQDACPFNSLYYDFYLRHEKKLGNNPRIGFAYMQIRKMKDEQKKQIKEKAKKLLNNLEGL